MSDFELFRRGRPAGHLAVDPAEAPRAVNLLRGGGFEVEGENPAAGPEAGAVSTEEAGELIRLEECEPEKPRPCEVATAIGYARDLAADAGIEAPAVQALIAQGGYRSEAEVQAAIEEVYRSAPPGDARLEAAFVLGRIFGGDALPQDLSPEDRAMVQQLIAESSAGEG